MTRQPFAKRAGRDGELAFAAAGVEREPNDDPVDFVFLDQLTVVASVAIRPAAFVLLEREGHRAPGVADGRANPPQAEVYAKNASHRIGRRPRYKTRWADEKGHATSPIAIVPQNANNFPASFYMMGHADVMMILCDGSIFDRE